MKATNSSLKRFATLVIIAVLSFGELFAQDYPCTVIDVKGSRYGDTMWMFTVEGTTDGYDNGWDGYKILGSSLAPQIFALDASNTKYQVMTSFNVQGTRIGFIPGEDNAYTFNFTHYFLSNAYQQLYLVDKQTNQTVDIYAQGSVYSFSCAAGDAQDRFTVVTFIESPVVNNTDTAVVDNGATTEEQPVVGTTPTNKKGGKGGNGGKQKSVKVFSASGSLVIDNPETSTASVTLTDAKSGRKVKKFTVAAKTITTTDARVKSGSYVVTVTTETSETNTMVLL